MANAPSVTPAVLKDVFGLPRHAAMPVGAGGAERQLPMPNWHRPAVPGFFLRAWPQQARGTVTP